MFLPQEIPWIYCFIVVLWDDHETKIHFTSVWTTECKITPKCQHFLVRNRQTVPGVHWRLTFMIHVSVSAAWRLIVHRQSSISFCYAVSLNVDWAGYNGRSAQFEHLNGRLGPPLDPKPIFICPLNPLFSHSARWRMARIWVNHYWNASLRAAD